MIMAINCYASLLCNLFRCLWFTVIVVNVLQPSHYHLPASKNYTLIAYRSSDIKTADPGRCVKNEN